MDEATRIEATRIVGARSPAVLTTRRLGDRLQSSPVLLSTDGSGAVLATSTSVTAKVRNLRRDPRATLCVLGDDFFDRWATFECRADIASLPGALDALVGFYVRRDGYRAGTHTAEELLSVWRAEERVLVRFTVERITGPGAGPGSARTAGGVPF